MNEIKKGQKYKTISPSDFHGAAILTVKSISGQNADDWIEYEAYPKIKYKRGYNKGSCRVWWIRDYCRRIE